MEKEREKNKLEILKEENQRLRKENESMKKEIELNKLRRQVTPHFLFNCISVASALVMQSPHDAVKFLKSFAQMYRYLLQYGNDFQVPIEQEINMMTEYFKLMTMRHIDCLKLDISAKAKKLKHHPIPPLALQGLVENAIKHNSHTPECPLTIKIDTDGEYLVITNKIVPLLSDTKSTHHGLNYINQSMLQLFNKSIIVTNDGNTFTVKIPLL